MMFSSSCVLGFVTPTKATSLGRSAPSGQYPDMTIVRWKVSTYSKIQRYRVELAIIRDTAASTTQREDRDLLVA
jgi:hypothetical protein